MTIGVPAPTRSAEDQQNAVLGHVEIERQGEFTRGLE